MKYALNSLIGWCAGLAIGMTIGLSQNNMALGIGLGVAFGASLGHLQRRKKIFQRKKKSRRIPLLVQLLILIKFRHRF